MGETAEFAKHLDDTMELRSLDQIPLIKPPVQHSNNRSRGISGSSDTTLQSVVRVQRRGCGPAGMKKGAPEKVIWLWTNKTKKKMLHTLAMIQISNREAKV